MSYIMSEPQVMELLKFQNKYGSFVKDQYLAEQATDLAKKAPEIWNPLFLKETLYFREPDVTFLVVAGVVTTTVVFNKSV